MKREKRIAKVTPKVRETVLGFAVLKAATVAVVTLLIGTSFGQSLVIAALSGSLGVIGMLGAAFIASRESRRTRDRVEDVARKVGADRRQADPVPDKGE